MRSCAALVGACIMTPIGTRFAWTMNGTSGPRSGCPQVAIGRAVGGAVGWAGDMVGGGRRLSLLLTIEFLRGPAGQPSPLLPPERAVCDDGLVSSFRENVAVRLQRRCRPNCRPHLPPSSSLFRWRLCSSDFGCRASSRRRWVYSPHRHRSLFALQYGTHRPFSLASCAMIVPRGEALPSFPSPAPLRSIAPES